MSVILDALPREWRQPVGRVGAGFAIGSVTGVVGGFVPILQEFVVEMKVPDAAKKLGPIGIARQMGNGGISLGTFFGLFQVRFAWLICHPFKTSSVTFRLDF